MLIYITDLREACDLEGDIVEMLSKEGYTATAPFTREIKFLRFADAVADVGKCPSRALAQMKEIQRLGCSCSVHL